MAEADRAARPRWMWLKVGQWRAGARLCKEWVLQLSSQVRAKEVIQKAAKINVILFFLFK